MNETREFFGPLETDYIATVQEFDLSNRLLLEKIIDANGTVHSLFTMKYEDKLQQRTLIKNNAENKLLTKTVYNAHSDVISVMDAEGHETTYHYDYRNNIQTTTDPNGGQIITYRDALDRIVKEERKCPLGILIKATDCFYDAVGNLRRQLETVMTPEESDRHVETQWEYNSMRQVIKTIEADKTSKCKITIYKYYPSGELEYVQKPNGIKLHYSYDGLGRLEEFYGSDESFNYFYEYDALSNPWKVHDRKNGVETLKQYHTNNLLKMESLANGLEINYDYDRMGRLTLVTLPDTSTIIYEYAGPHLHKVKRQNTRGQESYAHEYVKYDLNGHLRRAQRIGKVGLVEYEYDLQGRLKKIEEPHFFESIDRRDPMGHLEQRTIKDTITKVNCQYAYNALYQLKSEQGVASHSFVHDSLFNQVKKDDLKGVINVLNQLEGLGGLHFEYDLNGNRSLSKGLLGNIKYDYDALDRLIAVESPSFKVGYRYDEANRRIAKEHYEWLEGQWKPANVERYIYLSNTEVGICDQEGHIIQLRVLGRGKKGAAGAAVALELEGVVYAPLHDHMGHVMGLVSQEDGKVCEVYRYSSFGEEQILGVDGEELESSKNPWRYGSKRKDEETGLIYFGMRYYDCEVSRWLTPDPIGMQGGPNLYAYVLNNPLQYHDPFGLVDEGVSQENTDTSSSFSDIVSRVGRALSSIMRAPGRLVEHIGRNWVPVPIVKDAMEFAGYVMAGRDVQNYKPAWKREHSAFLKTDEGIDLPGVRYVIGSGILTSQSVLIERMFKAKDSLKGVRVYGIHGASHGCVMDTMEWGLERIGFRTNQVIRAERALKYLCKEVGDNGVIYMNNHSRFAETFYRSTRSFSENEKRLFDVTNFGGAHICEEGEYGKVRNIIADKDFVSLLANPIQYAKARTGNLANVQFLPYDGWPMACHSWDNDPYQGYFNQQARIFVKNYGLN